MKKRNDLSALKTESDFLLLCKEFQIHVIQLLSRMKTVGKLLINSMGINKKLM